jgi:hypothetical protein
MLNVYNVQYSTQQSCLSVSHLQQRGVDFHKSKIAGGSVHCAAIVSCAGNQSFSVWQRDSTKMGYFILFTFFPGRLAAAEAICCDARSNTSTAAWLLLFSLRVSLFLSLHYLAPFFLLGPERQGDRTRGVSMRRWCFSPIWTRRTEKMSSIPWCGPVNIQPICSTISSQLRARARTQVKVAVSS